VSFLQYKSAGNIAELAAKYEVLGAGSSYFSDMDDLLAGRRSFELSVQVIFPQ
jgi:hypothetical protein